MLTLAQANKIVEGALAKGRDLKLKPLGVAVMDARAVLLAYQAEDGSPLLRFDIAQGKAYGCLGVGMGGVVIADMGVNRPQFTEAMTALSHGKFVPVRGGVLIRDDKGAIIGAAGASGDTSDNDEACVVAGILAAGLKPDTGA